LLPGYFIDIPSNRLNAIFTVSALGRNNQPLIRILYSVVDSAFIPLDGVFRFLLLTINSLLLFMGYCWRFG
jgi:hypothetical protein